MSTVGSAGWACHSAVQISTDMMSSALVSTSDTIEMMEVDNFWACLFCAHKALSLFVLYSQAPIPGMPI